MFVPYAIPKASAWTKIEKEQNSTNGIVDNSMARTKPIVKPTASTQSLVQTGQEIIKSKGSERSNKSTGQRSIRTGGFRKDI